MQPEILGYLFDPRYTALISDLIFLWELNDPMLLNHIFSKNICVSIEFEEFIFSDETHLI